MMATATAPKLSTVLRGLVNLPGTCDRDLHGITLDSRLVTPGALFLACKGSRYDARQFIDAAIGQGASAVVVEADVADATIQLRHDVPVVPLPGLPGLMHVLAARFYGEPASRLQLMGITGTNGKTTCCHLLARLLSGFGHSCGIIGTLGLGKAGAPLAPLGEGPGTTPDAVRLQAILADFVEQGIDTVVMEVSSHALDQQRVEVGAFMLGVFTNLSRDHLDYHGDMAAYGSAKRRLFAGQGLEWAILNADDDYVAATRTVLPAGTGCLTWSLADPRADVYARRVNCAQDGLQLDIGTPWGEFSLHSRLLGSFNASNLLAVVTAALALGSRRPDFNPVAILEAAARLDPVPGRMQRIGKYRVPVVVDYAHTPDALEKALLAMREHGHGRLHLVFGCGGNRDQGKRARMGEVAARLADRIILTDDNPRDEDGTVIIEAIRSGLGGATAVVQRDRAAAIRQAILEAEAGDAVLVAGKGHETWQEVAGQRLPFSDAECVAAVLAQRAQEEAP